MVSTVAKNWGQVLAGIAAGISPPAAFGLYLTFGSPLTPVISPASNDLTNFYQLSNFASVHDYCRISAVVSPLSRGGIPNNTLVVTGYAGIPSSGDLRGLTLQGDGTPTQQILAVSLVYMPEYGNRAKDVVMTWDSSFTMNVPSAGTLSAITSLELI